MRSSTLLRVALGVCVVILLTAAPGFAEVAATATRAFTILKVSPDAAPPGGKVTILLGGDAKVLRVRFDGLDAAFEQPFADLVYAAVPATLRPGDKPLIRLYASDDVTEYALFTVSRATGQTEFFKPLSIVAAFPATARPGDFVTLQLSRPLRTDLRPEVSLNGNSIAYYSQRPGQIRLELPSDLTQGMYILLLKEGNESAFLELQIEEQRLLGIPRSRLLWTSISSLFLISMLATVAYQRWKEIKRFNKLARQYETARAFGPTDVGPTDVALEASNVLVTTQEIVAPDVPRELVEACASGKCLLFAGPGLGAQSLLPTRYEALLYLIERSELHDRRKHELTDALRQGQMGFVTEVLSSLLSRDFIIAELKVLYTDNNCELSQAHLLLQKIPFIAVLTTGWDGLIEKAFAKEKRVVITGESDVADIQRHDTFFIARLNGDLNEPESFVFSNDEYRSTLEERPTYAKFVASHVLNSPLFFVGMSLSGIEDFFDAFRFSIRAVSGGKSFAILPKTAYWETQQERFRTKYGVELIGYEVTRTAPHSALPKFLAKLEKEVSALAPKKMAQLSSAKLRRVQLTNIGAFESLTLDDLQSSWNMFLGNNGTGKSTILRAIALGLCGDDPEAMISAERLLRYGTRTGRIELQVGDITYRTDLLREGERVVVRSAQIAPLQKGSVVLGFPPLRGVSQREPTGISPPGPSMPRVADLLPLIRSTIDTRLDSLKDWLVNLDANSKLTDIPKAEAQRSERTIVAFFDLLRRMTPGQAISRGEISRQPWRVYVNTEDGPMPIDAVSQGMSSIFGWAGTLIQRMFEIYSDAEAPTKQPAVVLVDEIDAHLHPEWQQKLTGIVREHFPNVQILATTHSPLIVAGMKQNELLIARRDPADRTKVEVLPSPIDPEGLRADQVLTSPIFGLMSTRSPQTSADIKRFSVLVGLGKAKRSAEQEQEFLELQTKLSTILTLGETYEEREQERDQRRRIEEKFQRSIDEAAGATEEAKDELKKRMNRLFPGQDA